MTATGPTFHLLNHDECEALLTSQHVGRMAFSFRDRVDIEPIHYVYRDGRIYGRTQIGTKVDVLAHHPWVAFEVDHITALFSWKSVVVHGRVTFPDPNGAPNEQEQFFRGVEAFRSLVPDAFTESDPTPARELVFVLIVQDMTGRSATPSRGATS
ncbi:MAG: pyridoxamine 5'-phosphate oxidase family protein [Gemmatimonadaceae bacterium]|nr:pyridoxamine 5'-phosphate oxidase family protein [Gemmatimonadaceae bacterium]MCC6432788.1 pyridoxamine 5'-phosphate oxidase family protein [Gemmatimonadaceae bacterium]